MIKTWCDAMERADARLLPGDIEKALEEYRKSTGRDAGVVYLNAKMIKRVGETVPEGVAVVEHDGVASWEVWMDGGENIRGFLPLEISKTQKFPVVEKILPSPSLKPMADLTKSKSTALQNSSSKKHNANYAKSLLPTKNYRGRPEKELQENFLDILFDDDMTLMEKGEKLGIHFSTVQRRIKKLERSKK